ncbi:MAG: Gfo/Idh/MocA family oxidoreductase [Candidatus Delongbacteria bacterium]|jgi:predicted dehydrogenase|nr:Gfo/Idh/MocA family oxidoreductase [Candidatus Delongbacteria bacterium]
MSKLKVGVIGCGHLGKFHTKMHTMLPDISELIGVYDLNPEQSQKVSGEFNCKQFHSIEDLLSMVDAVIIASATQSHYEVAKQCLNANKSIFIEKPITATVPQAEEIVTLAEEKGLIIQVGHIERYNPAFFQIEDMNVDPMFIEAHRLASFNPRGSDVSVVHDLMIHDIDLILSLISADVVQVDAAGVAALTDTPDIANVRIKFANGAVANLTASRISIKKMRKFRIFQKEMYISLDLDKGAADIFSLADESDTTAEGMAIANIESKGKKIMYVKNEEGQINALLEENRDFVNSVLNGSPVKVTGKDGLRALVTAEMVISEIDKQIKT